jgi:hypothetical protein
VAEEVVLRADVGAELVKGKARTGGIGHGSRICSRALPHSPTVPLWRRPCPSRADHAPPAPTMPLPRRACLSRPEHASPAPSMPGMFANEGACSRRKGHVREQRGILEARRLET